MSRICGYVGLDVRSVDTERFLSACHPVTKPDQTTATYHTDAGAAVAAAGFALKFAAGTRGWWLGLSALSGLAGLAYMVRLDDNRWSRIMSFSKKISPVGTASSNPGSTKGMIASTPEVASIT